MSSKTGQPSADSPEQVAPNVNTLWARVFVDELYRAGLRQVCISPGSRSAPLVFQFAAHPGIVDHSVVDERSAAFFALGLARAGGGPVALLCTSGTAAANYYPAVCEAERDRIPLLVLTGDRPAGDHECGTQQVMDQYALYGSHVRWFRQLAQPEASASGLASLRSIACRAVHRTLHPVPGPVHLNAPFRKPLEPIAPEPGHPDHIPADYAGQSLPEITGRPGNDPWIRLDGSAPQASDADIAELAEWLAHSRRPLFIAGADPAGFAYREAVTALAEHAAIPVLAEPASGLRHWSQRGVNVLAAGELIASSRLHDRIGYPDLVIHTGRAPLTWSMQKFLARTRCARHVAIDPGCEPTDPEHLLAWQLVGEPADVLGRLTRRVGPASDECSRWLDAHQRAERSAIAELQRATEESGALAAPALWQHLGRLLPDGAALVLSSSMPVRDADTFMAASRRSLTVHFNRGLNGIDGVVSTAAGVAAARKAANSGPTVLVIGDVALRHDATALLLATEMALDLTVVVIDNDGGEIFDYLPSAGFEPEHGRHFATEGRTPVDQAVPRGVKLLQPCQADEFCSVFAGALADSGPSVIQVRTRRGRDRKLRDALIERIAARISRGGTPLVGTR